MKYIAIIVFTIILIVSLWVIGWLIPLLTVANIVWLLIKGTLLLSWWKIVLLAFAWVVALLCFLVIKTTVEK